MRKDEPTMEIHKRTDGGPIRKVALQGPPKRPKRILNGLIKLINRKVGNLTRTDEKKKEEFLSRHPNLVQELSRA